MKMLMQNYKHFRLHVSDQFIQKGYNFINISSHFVTLRELSDDFMLPVNMTIIKYPIIQLLFTGLRIYINVLSTSGGSKTENIFFA